MRSSVDDVLAGAASRRPFAGGGTGETVPGDAQPRGGPSRSAPSTSAARHAVHSTTVKVTRVKVTRGGCGNPHGRPVRRRHISIRCSVGSARSPRAPQGASSTAKSSSRGPDIFDLKMSPEDERKGRRFGPRAASAAGRSRADRYYRITHPSLYGTLALFSQRRMLKTTAAPTRLDRRNSRQHLDRVPVLPTHGTVSNWGPFQRDVVTSVPPRVVVYTTCVVLSLFLVACGVVVTSSNKEPGFASSGSLNLDAGVTHGGRQLTQWLAPVWYSLPTLFDSLYNLGESLVRLGITPEEYRVAAEINAEAERERALEAEQYEDEYSYASNAVDEPADEDPNDGFDTWPGYDMYDGRFGETPFYRSR